jgi:hypothetical protein
MYFISIFGTGESKMKSLWQDLYQAAIFESDRSKVLLRIEAAARAIQEERARVGITYGEADKLHHAMRMLAVLRSTSTMQAA